MHVASHTALVVSALAASGYLFAQRSERAFAAVALVAAGVETLLALHLLSLSLAGVRLEIALAAALVVGGGICWWRASARAAVSASTIVVAIGAMQLLAAAHVLR